MSCNGGRSTEHIFVLYTYKIIITDDIKINNSRYILYLNCYKVVRKYNQ